ncbi:hypothetical protein [Salibacterium aidingense]|uniref:hypothetical protein n=1 Tax=Salibacterium aidingense TaxID=384933 RepID=UPI00041BFC17|nr:hypothetical protein [Salibacterium aidingense]
MSYFAIQCRSGHENALEQFIQSMDHHWILEAIQKIISPAIVETKINGGVPVRENRKTSMGYVFIKVNSSYIDNRDSNLPSFKNEFYHFFKRIPFVSQILTTDIPEEEVRTFCQKSGLDIDNEEEDAHVIIEANKVHERNKKERLKEVNGADNQGHREYAEALLQQELKEPTCVVEKIERLIQKGKEKGHHIFAQLYYEINQKKEGDRLSLYLPHTFMVQALSYHQKEGTSQQLNNALKSPKILLEYLYTYMKTYVQSRGGVS